MTARGLPWLGYLFSAALVIGVVAIGVALLAGPSQTSSSEGEPLTPTQPPAPRNDCEREFSARLTDGLGLPTAAPPTPAAADIEAVMEVCTADELLSANEYFAFTAGRPMTYLSHRRLFNGPGHQQQLATLCTSADLRGTKACRTQGDPP